MERVLTCSVCGTDREPQPHETLPEQTQQTYAYCTTCNHMRTHNVKVKGAVEMEFDRRAGRS